MKKILAITAVSAVALFIGAQTVSAYGSYGGIVSATNINNTTIINNVSANANTGGNSADGGNAGEVSTGETSVDIFIETIVNGETVEYIDEHYEGSDIPDGGIHIETHYESEDKTVVVDTNIVVNAGVGELGSSGSSVNSDMPVRHRSAYRTRGARCLR